RPLRSAERAAAIRDAALTRFTGAVRAAVHRPGRFHAVADDRAVTMRAPRCEPVDGTLEAVEDVRDPVLHQHECLVVLVLAHRALHGPPASGAGPEPPIELALRFFAGTAVALLQLAGEDLGVSLDLIDVVVGELPPLLANGPLELRPLPLERIAIHAFLLV